MNKHNADPTQTYKMGINQFSAMTDAEFASIYLDFESYKSQQPLEVTEDNDHPIVGDIDWTTKGKVSQVKNQGQCGSCWAFSATGVSESYSLIKGKSVLLSEQELVDCSGSYGNHGCNGGWPSSALRYIKDKGIKSSSEYPYTGRNGQCKGGNGSFKISSVNTFKGCSSLQNNLNAQPISVCVDASNWSRYSSGVFSNCGKSINHAVLLVGILSGNWKIKNSWGSGWGEKGFIRLASGDTCGVCSAESTYPK